MADGVSALGYLLSVGYTSQIRFTHKYTHTPVAPTVLISVLFSEGGWDSHRWLYNGFGGQRGPMDHRANAGHRRRLGRGKEVPSARLDIACVTVTRAS